MRLHRRFRPRVVRVTDFEFNHIIYVIDGVAWRASVIVHREDEIEMSLHKLEDEPGAFEPFDQPL